MTATQRRKKQAQHKLMNFSFFISYIRPLEYNTKGLSIFFFLFETLSYTQQVSTRSYYPWTQAVILLPCSCRLQCTSSCNQTMQSITKKTGPGRGGGGVRTTLGWGREGGKRPREGGEKIKLITFGIVFDVWKVDDAQISYIGQTIVCAPTHNSLT